MAQRALRGTGIPYDVWCLGSDIWQFGRRRWTRWLIRRVLQGAACVLADGFGLAHEVQTLAGRPCHFLPSSRRLPTASPVIPRLAPGKAHLLFLGRWHPNKGVDLLPETMARLRQTGPAAHLHLFGSGPLEARLLALIRRYRVADGVSVHGYADPATAAAYLRACDLLVIPSRIESIPVVFSEAMQCGIPLAVADVGDLGRVVRHYQVGEVARPESAGELAAAIRRALARGRAFFQAGMARAAADWDVHSAAARYLHLVGD